MVIDKTPESVNRAIRMTGFQAHRSADNAPKDVTKFIHQIAQQLLFHALKISRIQHTPRYQQTPWKSAERAAGIGAHARTLADRSHRERVRQRISSRCVHASATR